MDSAAEVSAKPGALARCERRSRKASSSPARRGRASTSSRPVRVRGFSWAGCAASEMRGGAGRQSGPPRDGSREREFLGRDRTAATADPTRPAPRRFRTPSLALRRFLRDIAAPNRLKRFHAAQLLREEEPDGRGPPKPGGVSRHAGDREGREPWSDRCERSAQRRINQDRLAPAPATASVRLQTLASPSLTSTMPPHVTTPHERAPSWTGRRAHRTEQEFCQGENVYALDDALLRSREPAV